MNNVLIRLGLDMFYAAVSFTPTIVRGDSARLRTAVPGLLFCSKPRVLQRLSRRDPPQRIHAGHLADEIPESGVDLLPPPKGQPRLLLGESFAKFFNTFNKRIIFSPVISNKALQILLVAGEEGQVAPEYQPRLLLGGSMVRLV